MQSASVRRGSTSASTVFPFNSKTIFNALSIALEQRALEQRSDQRLAIVRAGVKIADGIDFFGRGCPRRSRGFKIDGPSFQRALCKAQAPGIVAGSQHADMGIRSEEHTSELQSLRQ